MSDPVRRLLATLALLLVLPLVLAGDTAANHRACAGTLSNYFNGVVMPRPYTDVSATLDSQKLDLCAGGLGLNSTWIALQGQPPYDIVQIGMWRSDHGSSGELRHFWAWGRMPATLPSILDLGPVDTSRPHRYRIAVVERDVHGDLFNRVQLYIDGELVATVSLDEVPWLRGGGDIALMAEGWNRGDSLGGTRADPYVFANILGRRPGGSATAIFSRRMAGYREPTLRIPARHRLELTWP